YGARDGNHDGHLGCTNEHRQGRSAQRILQPSLAAAAGGSLRRRYIRRRRNDRAIEQAGGESDGHRAVGRSGRLPARRGTAGNQYQRGASAPLGRGPGPATGHRARQQRPVEPAERRQDQLHGEGHARREPAPRPAHPVPELAEDTLMRRFILVFLLAMLSFHPRGTAAASDDRVRLKDLARIDGVRDNMLVGCGIVTGLSGTGDSSKSVATLQSIANALEQFGVNVTVSELSPRNVAGVMVVATLPAFARPGDKLEVNVSSVGDARSLAGGTLLIMPLYGPDKEVYALAQGPLAVGGYRYGLNGNIIQRNLPTSATISEGAIVERNVSAKILRPGDQIDVLLADPD